jgi:pimeloyl-ACP methyl ester carboxylesterase
VIVDVNGAPAHATTGGVAVDDPDRRDQPVVVLVHGAGMDATAWQLQTRYLAHHGCRPLAVDLPGHGRSQGPPLATIAELADWLAAFIEASSATTGADAVDVVGHSMGTFIGLELAARRPELVRSLVLLGTAAAMPVHPDLATAADDDLPAAAALMASWGHDHPAHSGPNPTPGLWMLGGARALIESSPPGALAADFRACAAYHGAVATAGAVTCPVTLGLGRGDKMTPPRAAAPLIEALHDPTVVELNGVGHMLMTEDPAAVRRLLLDAVAPSTA